MTKILVYSGFSDANIGPKIGSAEYSYFYVAREFYRVLEHFGDLVAIERPEEIPKIYRACEERGETCVFFCFSPPHRVPLISGCPTVVVMAWEFSTLPCQQWNDDPRTDWSYVFRHVDAVITLSRHTADLIRELMGATYPTFAVPVPTFDGVRGAVEVALQPEIIAPKKQVFIYGAPHDTDNAETDTKLLNEEVQDSSNFLGEGSVAFVDTKSDNGLLVVSEGGLSLPLGARGTAYGISVHCFRAFLDLYRRWIRPLTPEPLARLLSESGQALYKASRSIAPVRSGVDHAAVVGDVDRGVQLHTTQASSEAGDGLESGKIEAQSDIACSPEIADAQPNADVGDLLPFPQENVSRSMSSTTTLALRGVVYLSILNPRDGRKNWQDLLTGFCWAFRDEPNATLVLKMSCPRELAPESEIKVFLSEFSPMKCQIAILFGFLPDEMMQNLYRHATFYVNTSSGEGLCLPLVEAMSLGVPVIAPQHTAMADYVSSNNAFVLKSSLEQNVWPHDPRDLYQTMRYRLDWGSLVDAFHDSFRTITTEPEIYRHMSRTARHDMRQFSSDDVVSRKIRDVLKVVFSERRKIAA
ncbi:glycosyltransferase [Acetobacter sacchari]|uniref:Glycosyltransferase n=1 Tax=Acetobacter sacchari TaxID=2661687 RepID=A0ABS3LU93_9PROT|nr:glycosyltransferase [Acetobacter sacchari]MBO1359487.1 glycosyltransferase [Acetobacter sacchari]